MITKKQWKTFVSDVATVMRLNATYRGFSILTVNPKALLFTTKEKLDGYDDSQIYVIYNWEGYVTWHKRNNWGRQPQGKLRYLYEQVEVEIKTNLYEMRKNNER